jgi:putative acetyltransferase
MEIDVAVDDPRREDVSRLLGRHWDLAYELTPPEHVHALTIEQLLDPAVTVYTARSDGELVGIGALKELDRTHGELKSMHVAEEVRGQGVGRALVAHLLGVARERGLQRASLETGTGESFAPAQALYRSAGFVPCEPFAEYTSNPYSMCMTIRLA